jgi:hypothetical protein
LSKSDFLVKELANVSDVVNRNYKAAGGQGSLIEMDGMALQLLVSIGTP